MAITTEFEKTAIPPLDIVGRTAIYVFIVVINMCVS
jgi:hypothetical protein